jgi:hypothetical protein
LRQAGELLAGPEDILAHQKLNAWAATALCHSCQFDTITRQQFMCGRAIACQGDWRCNSGGNFQRKDRPGTPTHAGSLGPFTDDIAAARARRAAAAIRLP